MYFLLALISTWHCFCLSNCYKAYYNLLKSVMSQSDFSPAVRVE